MGGEAALGGRGLVVAYFPESAYREGGVIDLPHSAEEAGNGHAGERDGRFALAGDVGFVNIPSWQCIFVCVR